MVYPDHIVTEGSKYWLAKGVRILQGNRVGPTDARHLVELAGYMNLNGERDVADMGCGFGEVSRFLHKTYLPESHFWLINTNQFQLDHCVGGSPCPQGDASGPPNALGSRRGDRSTFFTRRLEDMCSTSIPSGAVDLVMFNYSLCHVDPRAELAEAERIARPGGKLFVYDYQRMSGDNELTEKVLAARFVSDAGFRVAAAECGWRDVETISPGGDDTLFREAAEDEALYDRMFDHLEPVIWKAHK